MRKHLKISNVLAFVALFAALGGTAFAAKTIISKPSQLKKGVVTNSKVKKGTLKANRLSDKAVASLQGQTGPKGPKGAKGAKGDTGPSGLASVTAVTDSVDISAGNSDALNVPCPAGTHLVGGGADTQNPTATITRDMPTVDGVPAADGETPNGWYGGAATGIEGISFSVYALCAAS